MTRIAPTPSAFEVDIALARRCAADGHAREELFRLHAPGAFRLARRLLGNVADAEDVVQEVFVDAFSSIHGYRGEAPLRSWLGRIVVRRALRHRRRDARRRPLEVLAGGALSAAPASEQARLDSRAVLRRVQGLLDRLHEDRRMIFVLHEVEGYSLPEAAALLGISVTAAKKRVWRARHELERLARRDGVLDEVFTAPEGNDVG